MLGCQAVIPRFLRPSRLLSISMKTISTFLSAMVLVGLSLPVNAQEYHRDFGGARVVQQNMTGLYNPSATYIGAGTLSRSAQGKGSGIGGSLPAVNMGSTVRTPGDNLYNNDGTDRQGNGALIYQDTERAMAAQTRYKMSVARARAQAKAKAQAQGPKGNLYIPGSNNGTSTYGSVSTPAVMYHGNGAATYSDGQKSGTRGF
jgi:hypothetical protein